jgi:dienelactone hydrolase
MSSTPFRVAVGVIALHVLDDNFVHPEPGTSAAGHLVSGLVPLALLGLAFWAYPRLRGAGRGATALLLGILGITAGVEAIYYARELGPSGDDYTGLLAVPAGLALLVIGAITLWTTRRTGDHVAWRYARRALLGVAGALAVAVIVFPIAFAYVVTHTGRAVVPADRLDMPHENVTFTTRDGLELEGWYVPSRNGAAVIASPGRNGPQRQTRMLARHGYGVLLFDRRGEGKSDGRPNAFGWGGDADIKAAIAYLKRRPDVDPARIGGIGLSVGGELMLEAAADTSDLAAVVSEGAGARTFAEEQDEPKHLGAVDKVIDTAGTAVRWASVAVFSGRKPPTHLADLVPRIAPRPLLLIAAPHSKHGEELNRDYIRSAGASAALWEIPESKHVGGIRARPEEYERRVVGFFDRALRPAA